MVIGAKGEPVIDPHCFVQILVAILKVVDHGQDSAVGVSGSKRLHADIFQSNGAVLVLCSNRYHLVLQHENLKNTSKI